MTQKISDNTPAFSANALWRFLFETSLKDYFTFLIDCTPHWKATTLEIRDHFQCLSRSLYATLGLTPDHTVGQMLLTLDAQRTEACCDYDEEDSDDCSQEADPSGTDAAADTPVTRYWRIVYVFFVQPFLNLCVPYADGERALREQLNQYSLFLTQKGAFQDEL